MFVFTSCSNTKKLINALALDNIDKYQLKIEANINGSSYNCTINKDGNKYEIKDEINNIYYVILNNEYERYISSEGQYTKEIINGSIYDSEDEAMTCYNLSFRYINIESAKYDSGSKNFILNINQTIKDIQVTGDATYTLLKNKLSNYEYNINGTDFNMKINGTLAYDNMTVNIPVVA